jgi:hypothetical protein
MMKMLLTLLLAQPLAYASYFATHCSNASGSFHWESGQIRNELTFTFYGNSGPETAVVPLEVLTMEMSQEQIIKDETQHVCGMYSKTKIWSAWVEFKPALAGSDVFSSLPEQKLQDYVICRYHLNSRAPCPEEPKAE